MDSVDVLCQERCRAIEVHRVIRVGVRGVQWLDVAEAGGPVVEYRGVGCGESERPPVCSGVTMCSGDPVFFPDLDDVVAFIATRDHADQGLKLLSSQ